MKAHLSPGHSVNMCMLRPWRPPRWSCNRCMSCSVQGLLVLPLPKDALMSKGILRTHTCIIMCLAHGQCRGRPCKHKRHLIRLLCCAGVCGV